MSKLSVLTATKILKLCPYEITPTQKLLPLQTVKQEASIKGSFKNL